jgi:hypothetical protein
MMEEREPVAKEKEITPIIIRMMHKIFSDILTAEMSP